MEKITLTIVFDILYTFGWDLLAVHQKGRVKGLSQGKTPLLQLCLTSSTPLDRTFLQSIKRDASKVYLKGKHHSYNCVRHPLHLWMGPSCSPLKWTRQRFISRENITLTIVFDILYTFGWDLLAVHQKGHVKGLSQGKTSLLQLCSTSSTPLDGTFLQSIKRDASKVYLKGKHHSYNCVRHPLHLWMGPSCSPSKGTRQRFISRENITLTIVFDILYTFGWDLLAVHQKGRVKDLSQGLQVPTLCHCFFRKLVNIFNSMVKVFD